MTDITYPMYVALLTHMKAQIEEGLELKTVVDFPARVFHCSWGLCSKLASSRPTSDENYSEGEVQTVYHFASRRDYVTNFRKLQLGQRCPFDGLPLDAPIDAEALARSCVYNCKIFRAIPEDFKTLSEKLSYPMGPALEKVPTREEAIKAFEQTLEYVQTSIKEVEERMDDKKVKDEENTSQDERTVKESMKAQFADMLTHLEVTRIKHILKEPGYGSQLNSVAMMLMSVFGVRADGSRVMLMLVPILPENFSDTVQSIHQAVDTFYKPALEEGQTLEIRTHELTPKMLLDSTQETVGTESLDVLADTSVGFQKYLDMIQAIGTNHTPSYEECSTCTEENCAARILTPPDEKANA